MLRASIVSLVGLLAGLLAAPAWGSWVEPVGGPLNATAANDALRPSVAAVGSVPYVAWIEADDINLEVRVARLNAAGTAWEAVGAAASINADRNANALDASIADIGGVPWVAWAEDDGVNFEIRVARLNAAGTAWTEVVGGLSPINHAANRDAIDPQLISVGGVPHVAWVETDGVALQLRAARLNTAGTDWEELAGGSSANASPTQLAASPSLADVGGVAWLAWREDDGVNFEIRVAHPNAAGTDWDEVVGGASPVNRDPAQDGGHPSLTALGGVPYVAWDEAEPSGRQVRAARLNGAGTDWVEVVGGTSPINHDPARLAFDPTLIGIDGVPYVSWRELDEAGDVQLRAARLGADGAGWQEIVGGARPIDVAPGVDASFPDMAAVGGIPYVTWLEDAGGVDKVRVKRLVPDFLPDSTAFATSPTSALLIGRLRTYGVPAQAGFELGPGAGFGTVTPLARTADGPGEDTVVAEVTGLAPATRYSWRAVASDGTYRTATDATRTLTTLALPATPPAPQPPGPAPPGRLVGALVSARLSGTVGKRLPIGYFSTTDAAARLELRRKRALVATLTGTAKPGRNTLTWPTRAKGKALPAGSYAFTLVLTTPDGQTVRATGTVRLVAARAPR